MSSAVIAPTTGDITVWFRAARSALESRATAGMKPTSLAGDDIHRFVDGRQEGGEGQSAHDFGLSEMKKPAHGGLGIASDWVASRRLSCRP
jgi:hypothetical protein